LLVDGVLALGEGVVPAAGVLCPPGATTPPGATAPVPPALAPPAVAPAVPLLPEALEGDVVALVVDEPVPEAPDEVEPVEVARGCAQAASTKAQAKGTIHLVM
jgi:hypothetical protein